jgi:hypothetical protein
MSLSAGFNLRRASTADLDILVAHRRAMFEDMGYNDDLALNSMSAKFRVWLLQHMNLGDYRAWLVCAPDGAVAAGAGLWLMDWPPHMVGQGAPPYGSSAPLVPRERHLYDHFARQPIRPNALRIDGIHTDKRDASTPVDR